MGRPNASQSRLKMQQRFRLGNEILKIRDQILATKPSYTAVAATVAPSLDFAVKAADVKNAAAMAGLTWTPERRATPGTFRPPTATIARLEKAVRHLYRKLGEPVPEGLTTAEDRGVPASNDLVPQDAHDTQAVCQATG